MATLTAWKFEDPDKAEEAMGVLESLRKQELIHVIDAAWVSWQPGKKGEGHPGDIRAVRAHR